ncbi:MAG: hypothetical protein N2B06_11660 [Clostridium sp.]
MKKNNLSWIIIISTFISATTMSSYSGYISNSNQYERGGIIVQKVSEIKIQSKNNDKESPDIKNNLKEAAVPAKKNSSDHKSEDENSSVILDASSTNVDIEETAWDKNIENEQNEQSVFKVSTGKIMESLTPTDKIKLLYISIKLGKDNYKKVEEHLYATDAENGVLKALKLLKENLSEKEYEKVRIIAGKFIDMEAAEELY